MDIQELVGTCGTCWYLLAVKWIWGFVEALNLGSRFLRVFLIIALELSWLQPALNSSKTAEPWMTSIDLELSDHAEGSCSWGGSAPISVVVVLATFQEVLVSVVVGLLIQDPGTIHHHTGVELLDLQGIIHWWAVIGTLCRQTSKVLFVIESDLPGLSIDLEKKQRSSKYL